MRENKKKTLTNRPLIRRKKSKLFIGTYATPEQKELLALIAAHEGVFLNALLQRYIEDGIKQSPPADRMMDEIADEAIREWEQKISGKAGKRERSQYLKDLRRVMAIRRISSYHAEEILRKINEKNKKTKTQ